jgi:hypothetical protein
LPYKKSSSHSYQVRRPNRGIIEAINRFEARHGRKPQKQVRLEQPKTEKQRFKKPLVVPHRVENVKPPLKVSVSAKLVRLSDEEVKASQRGMDQRIEGWKLGDYHIYLLYNQIFRNYWTRIEKPDGSLVDESTFAYHENSRAETLNKLADQIEKLTGNRKVAEEFREPLREKKSYELRQKNLLERIKTDPVIAEFGKRFNYDHEIDESSIDPETGMVMNNNRTVALLTKGPPKTWEKGTVETMRFVPKSRALLKDAVSRVYVEGQLFDAEYIYKALMVLDMSQPIKIETRKTMHLLLEDYKGTQIVIAPILPFEDDSVETFMEAPTLTEITNMRTKTSADRTSELQKEMERVRKNVEADGQKYEKEAKAKDYLTTEERRESWINSELGHRSETELYLTIKEKLTKRPHDEVFKPYHENKGLWKDGKLLI